MAEDVSLKRYFERIGFAGSIAPTLGTLEALHLAHPQAIAFENLNPIMGMPVPLDLKSLSQKLLTDKRGGYCFEHNTLFANVLHQLDYTVRAHAARPMWNYPPGTVGRRSHMILSVEISGATYLVDVGFGGMTLTAPLKIKSEVEQATPHDTFRIMSKEGTHRLEVRLGEEWKPVYQFDLTPQLDGDFDFANYYQSSHPLSRHRSTLIAARPAPGQRHALYNTRLSTHVLDGETTQVTLGSVAEIKDALSSVFGIALPPAEILDPALERILAQASNNPATSPSATPAQTPSEDPAAPSASPA